MHSIFLFVGLLAIGSTAGPLSFFPGRSKYSQNVERRQHVDVAWPYQTFISEPSFLPPIPEIVKKHRTAPGYHFLAQQGPGGAQEAAMIMTDDGDLVWQSDPEFEFPATNFSPQKLNGKPVLVYNMAVGAPIVESGAITYTIVQIFDDTYNLLYNVSVEDPTFVFADGDWGSLVDSHEAYITDWDTLVVPAYNITPWDLSAVGGPENGWLIDSVFYEVTIPNGEILYSWRSSREIPVTDALVPLDELYGFGNTSGWAWDYFHINSIQPWGDDGYLVSARNTFDVLFVNKTSDSVQWRLRGNNGGDFDMDEEGQFSYQHDARLHLLDDELLLSVFDNRNDLPPPYVPSVGHLFTLDLGAMTAKIKTAYVNRTAVIASQFGESMQVELQGDDKYVVLGQGSQPITEEYDLDGTLRMSWRFGPEDPTGGPPGIANYRVRKGTWKGYPTTLPSVKACATETGVDIFASWNGATEVKDWVLYVGESEAAMQEKVTVPKSGFETKFTVDIGDAIMISVQAQGNGQDERFYATSSPIVSVQQC